MTAQHHPLRPIERFIPGGNPRWFYQIYPWSFQDSNHDGIGDLRGIQSRLEYLGGDTAASLGIDAIWLPAHLSFSDARFQHDVSDYVNIDPRFGTLNDFDALAQEAQ